MTLEKAKLTPISGDGGEEIEFMFNPNQLAFSRTIQLNQPRGARDDQGIPKVSFAHPNPYSLKINNILLDTYEKGESVMPLVEKFRGTVTFSQQAGDKMRPPAYIFSWGRSQYLRCFVKALNYKLTMFLPNGTPVRATVELDLQEVDEASLRGDTQPPARQRSDSRDRRMAARPTGRRC